MFYDDLPVWGFIGKVEKVIHQGTRTADYKYYLFTHFHFDMSYNENRCARQRMASCSRSCRTRHVHFRLCIACASMHASMHITAT